MAYERLLSRMELLILAGGTVGYFLIGTILAKIGCHINKEFKDIFVHDECGVGFLFVLLWPVLIPMMIGFWLWGHAAKFIMPNEKPEAKEDEKESEEIISFK